MSHNAQVLSTDGAFICSLVLSFDTLSFGVRSSLETVFQENVFLQKYMDFDHACKEASQTGGT